MGFGKGSCEVVGVEVGRCSHGELGMRIGTPEALRKNFLGGLVLGLFGRLGKNFP